jgi:hypothetical protein
MKNKIALLQLGIFLTLLVCSENAFAKGTPIGDITLIGRVERLGQQLVNDTTLFEGDTIRTHANSGGIVRIGRGRLDLDPNSEVEIVSEQPLKIVVKSGGVRFNFPVGTDFEIVTPQLDIHPTPGTGGYSGSVTAQPKKEDRVTSRKGRYSILEREEGGDTNTIHDGQVLVAALVMPALPQAGANIIATITDLSPAGTAQVNVGRAGTPVNNYAIRATQGMTLGNGDRVRSLQGNARIQFTSDGSVITLRPGTQVTIQEQMQQGGLLRSISQVAGSLYFSIQKLTQGGTNTRLSTPTAVAAIRGTIGENTDQPDSTIFALQEGEEFLTESFGGSTLTLRSGQTVTAFRGLGFGAVTALVAAIAPSVGAAGPGGAGGGGGGAGGAGGGAAGGAGGAGGGAAGAGTGAVASTTTAAAASTISSVATAVIATVVPTTAALLVTAHEEAPASASGPVTCPGVCTGL